MDLVDVHLSRHLFVMQACYRVGSRKAFDVVIIRILFDLGVLVLVERVAPLEATTQRRCVCTSVWMVMDSFCGEIKVT